MNILKDARTHHAPPPPHAHMRSVRIMRALRRRCTHEAVASFALFLCPDLGPKCIAGLVSAGFLMLSPRVFSPLRSRGGLEGSFRHLGGVSAVFLGVSLPCPFKTNYHDARVVLFAKLSPHLMECISPCLNISLHLTSIVSYVRLMAD